MNKIFPFVVLALVGCSNQNATFTKQPTYPQTEEEVSTDGCLAANNHWTLRDDKGNATHTFDLICLNPEARIPCWITTHLDENGNGEGWGTCEGWSFRDHWTYRFGKMNWRQQETSKKE